ncbi:CRIB domain-containing protein RIC7 [Alnus glutinosa]|uniref:CRIB domain-containing protein RIC7 n=1 Tax=Alnus glutinosa TaxID=3517 RepID=UPI002D792F7D|nr:CRIB domain-containing protein RIC7 [Alnus glutinosa]
MSNTKMKGLLKGLRYISQIFDNDKEPEMQIGYPTDVKHVAHIGWDGPSVNSPSWMNEFKSPPGYSSVPINLPGEVKEDNGDQAKWHSEDSGARRSARTPNSPAGDLLELPRSSRRQSSSSSSTGAVTGSPSRSEKPEKPRQSRRSTKSSLKDSSEGTKSSRQQPVLPLESSSSSPARSLPDIPKKTRRKKSKEYSNGGGGGSTRSARLKAQATEETYQSPFSDPGPGAGSVSTSRNNELLSPQPFEGGSRKGYMGGIY